MEPTQKTIACREIGWDCDWEVRDTDEAEVLTSTQGHAKRKHGAEVSVDQIRPLVREETSRAHERARGI